MQDRFKFRAWDKRDKSYYNPLDTNVNGVQLALKNEKVSFDMFAADVDNPNIVIEQCTGRRDCDDNLIYEGDIVHIPGWSTPFVVVFENGAFRLYKDKYLRYVMPVDMYVIGNIHENVDLFEEVEK